MNIKGKQVCHKHGDRTRCCSFSQPMLYAWVVSTYTQFPVTLLMFKRNKRRVEIYLLVSNIEIPCHQTRKLKRLLASDVVDDQSSMSCRYTMDLPVIMINTLMYSLTSLELIWSTYMIWAKIYMSSIFFKIYWAVIHTQHRFHSLWIKLETTIWVSSYTKGQMTKSRPMSWIKR